MYIAQLEELALTSPGVSWLVSWCVTLCSSTQETGRDQCNTVLERGKIAHECPTIKNTDFPSQDPGTSFMSNKLHILT